MANPLTLAELESIAFKRKPVKVNDDIIKSISIGIACCNIDPTGEGRCAEGKEALLKGNRFAA